LSVLVTEYYSSDQIEKNDMGGAYGMYGGEVRYTQGFGWET